jgi:hypothetical protein
MNICKICEDEIEDRFFDKKKSICIHCAENERFDLKRKYDCDFISAGLHESDIWR